MEGLRRALESLDEPSSCEGTFRITERLAIMLPDGDLAAADDAAFVDWLVEHGELAPFGHARETKIDPAVRLASRVGGLQVGGFDPADVLGEIEAALSPRMHLVATLTDLLVYPTGGHFAQHKDTPRSPELVGTLIVGLPIEHAGGAFQIHDGRGTRVIDWSGPVDPTLLKWVALFSDVDHEITPVESGARVTLVYALAMSDRVRRDNGWHDRIAAVAASARRLQLPETGPLMIACARHVIALDGPQPQGIETLRGVDRDLADALEDAGLHVAVRTCLVARDLEDDSASSSRFRAEGELFFARLDRPFLETDIAALLDCVTFQQSSGDGGGVMDEDNSNLEPYLVDTVPVENWIIRGTAAATFIRAVEFAGDGFIGNAANDAFLYKLAALEVTRR